MEIAEVFTLTEWTTVKMPKGLVDAVKEFLKTKTAEKAGFASPSEFCRHAVRETLALFGGLDDE